MNFEEFKEGFVAVLSRSLDFSTSEEESSYLEPGTSAPRPVFIFMVFVFVSLDLVDSRFIDGT